MKIAARAPFPIIAVSARIPLPALPNKFDGRNAPNTSIAFVSGLADLRHDSSGIAVRGAGAPPARTNDRGAGSGAADTRDAEQLKDYLLTYGVGNQESYATQVSQSEACPVVYQQWLLLLLSVSHVNTLVLDHICCGCCCV